MSEPESGRRRVERYLDETRRRAIAVSEKTTTVRLLSGRPVTILELPGAASFRAGGALFQPDLQREGEAPALVALAAGLAFLREKTPPQHVLVAGHTEASGALSAQRAQSTQAVLSGDAEGWTAQAEELGAEEDWAHLLSWLAATRGWACDPGSGDAEALAGFRSAWEASGKPGIPAGAGPVAEDWRAVFTCMQEELAALLEVEGSELQALQGRLERTEPGAVGCGEDWTPSKVRIREHTPTVHERVDLLFFAKEDLPNLVCHSGGTCNWKKCDVYRKSKYRAVPLSGQGGGAEGTFEAQFVWPDVLDGSLPADLSLRFSAGAAAQLETPWAAGQGVEEAREFRFGGCPAGAACSLTAVWGGGELPLLEEQVLDDPETAPRWTHTLSEIRAPAEAGGGEVEDNDDTRDTEDMREPGGDDDGPPSLERMEIEDVAFGTEREILLPYGWGEVDLVTGLSVVAAAMRHAQANPDKRLIVVGHTDTTGSASFNQTLSADRAKNVHLYLTGQKEEWAAHCQEHYEAADVQQVLAWLHHALGWEEDPGTVDNMWGPNSDAAREGFRERYNRDYGGELPRGSKQTQADWEAFFVLYDEELARKLNVSVVQVGEFRAGLRFTEPATLACGEAWPLEQPGVDGFASAANRRVDVLFFDEEDLPTLDGSPSGQTIYEEGRFRTIPLDVAENLRENDPPPAAMCEAAAQEGRALLKKCGLRHRG